MNRFEMVHYEKGSALGKDNGDKIIYRDTETGVLYLWVRGGASGSGLTVMVDADGNPLIE